MDSLLEIRKQLAEICDKSANSKLGTLITDCVSVQIAIDKWCRNKTFLLYSLPALVRVIYENQEMIVGTCDWLYGKDEKIVVINDIPFMNDESDLDFLDRIVKLISDKLKEVGPILFAGLAYIGQNLILFFCEAN